MNKLLIGAGLAVLAFVSHAQQQANSSKGHTRTIPVESIDDKTYFLTELSEDKTYGYDKLNPIKVGGEGGGPRNERRFLNALLGPEGQELKFFRAGSCCHFETPNGLVENMAMLDIYRITWEGAADTLSLYLNMYDNGDLKIPAGLRAKIR